jgi:hypothetical protein
MFAAVKHLHAFTREADLTPAEWIKGIEFMTRVGKMCTPERQEFILLPDTVDLSALVNLLHDRTAIEEGTDTSLLGPFYRENTPKRRREAPLPLRRLRPKLLAERRHDASICSASAALSASSARSTLWNSSVALRASS